MKREEVIKEKIKIQLVRFQVYVFSVIALAGAVYGLSINYQENVINKYTFGLGIILLIGLLIAIAHNYKAIRKLIKELEKTK